MAICPPLPVPAPALTPYVAGLFSAALFPPLPSGPDGGKWQCGVQYEGICPQHAGVWVDECPDEPPQLDKRLSRWRGMQLGAPFHVYDGYACPPVGRPPADAEAKARATLLLSEQVTVEDHFWQTQLANAGCTPLAADAVSLVGAVSALEAFLAANYPANGILHAPRGLAAYAAERQLIESRAGKLTTVLGNRWAFGGGYSVNLGPDGQPAPPGHGWLYATGEVSIYRGEIMTHEPRLDTRRNELIALAERTYVIVAECVCAAVLVRLTDCCPTPVAPPPAPVAAPVPEPVRRT